jgi:hypothetical protein
MHISTRRSTAIQMPQMVMGLDGTAKNSNPRTRYPVARVVYENAKNPDPRECIIGGLTKIDTNRKVHQMKLRPSAKREMARKARTLHRL